jgi:hypothetical protein
MLRVLPAPAPFVWLSAGAALHVFRLVRRYNWCVSEPSRKQARWRRFWRRISQCERHTLFLLLQSTGCPMGRPAHIGEVPAAFARYARSHRQPPLTESVEFELGMLLMHVNRSAAGAISNNDTQLLQ